MFYYYLTIRRRISVKSSGGVIITSWPAESAQTEGQEMNREDQELKIQEHHQIQAPLTLEIQADLVIWVQAVVWILEVLTPFK